MKKTRKYQFAGLNPNTARALSFNEWYRQNYGGNISYERAAMENPAIISEYQQYASQFGTNPIDRQIQRNTNYSSVDAIPTTGFTPTNALPQEPIGGGRVTMGVDDPATLGFNQDSDGVWRKTEVTENNNLGYSGFFQALNPLLDITRAIGSAVNDARNMREERRKLLEARYNMNDIGYNPNAQGVNNIPMYFEKGGEVSQAKAKKILKDGKIRGKKLTDKQKAYFGWIAGGKKQTGGYVNNTGYLPNSPTADNPYNIIPSNNITMNGVPQDLLAIPNVGTPTFMPANSGTYNFPNAKYVTEIPMYQNGGEIDPFMAQMFGIPYMENPQLTNQPQVDYNTYDYIPTPGSVQQGGNYRNPRWGSWVEDPTNKNKDIDPEFYIDEYRYVQNERGNNTLEQEFIGRKTFNSIQEKNKYIRQRGDLFFGNDGTKSHGIVIANAKTPYNVSKKEKRQIERNRGRYLQNGGRANFASDADYQRYLDYQAYLANNPTTTPTNTQTAANLQTWSPENNIGLNRLTPQEREAANKFNVQRQTTGNPWYGTQVFNPTTNTQFEEVRTGLIDWGGQRPQGAPATYEEQANPLQMWAWGIDPQGNRFRRTTYPEPLIDRTSFDYGTRDPFLNPNTRITNDKSRYYSPGSAYRQYYGRELYQTGGQVEVKGVRGGESELERGEVFQNQLGQIQKVAETEPTHEQGGSKQNFVHRVLEDTSDKRKDKESKALKVQPQEAKEILGFKPKRAMTHSKLYEEATKFYDRKLNKLQKTVEENLDYVKYQNGGKYAQNSLDENLKLMSEFPTHADIFDVIYDHQEEVKRRYKIDQERDEMKKGGKKNSYYQNGGSDYWTPHTRFNPQAEPYNQNNLPFGYGDPAYITQLMQQLNSVTGNTYPTTPQGLVEMRQDQFTNNQPFVQHAGNLNYWNRNATENIQYQDPRGKYDAIGVLREPLAFDTDEKLQQYMQTNNAQRLDPNDPSRIYWIDPTTGRYIGANVKVNPKLNFGDPKPPFEQAKAEAESIRPTEVATTTPNVEAQIQPTQDGEKAVFRPQSTQASEFYEPLRWYDVAGNILNYLSSERIPVDLEQLQREPLQPRLLNPLPALQQNQADFNAAVEQLPTSGVGFANQANLMAQRYAANNQVLGQYENQNRQLQNQMDQYNDQAQYALRQTNMGLRDQFTNRVLQSREVQRQSRLNALDDLFTKIAQNRKLNREGNLVMQMTPYFDQFAQYNGNVLDITNSFNNQFGSQGYRMTATNNPNGSTTATVYDKDGNVVKQTVREKTPTIRTRQ